MQKKYIVRLTAAEREELLEVVKRLKGSSQQVRRAQMLLKADADGPAWSDQRIADAFGCRRQTVEKVRERFVTEGFEVTLRGKRPAEPPRKPVLNGEQQAKVRLDEVSLEVCCNHSSGDSAADYMQPFLDSLAALRRHFQDDPQATTIIDREIRSVHDWIDDHPEEDARPPRRLLGNLAPSEPSHLGRSIFEDVDV